jgi:photosystem II stability/assembly factor-like uncharacterized protein
MDRSRVRPLPAHIALALLTLLVGLACLLTAAPARAGWVAHDAGTPFTLNAVCFTDASSGWAVGFNGGIFVTSDGGKIWSPQASGNTSPLNDVTFRSGIGWVFGGEFAATWILTTTNGGGTWTPQAHTPPAVFTAGDFTDSQHGWAVTTVGWAYRTTDGGTHWTGAATPAESEWASLNDIDMIGPSHGCTVGERGYVLTTDDAGESWDVAPSGVTVSLLDADFAEGVGWAVGEAGTILKTTDGGLHWSPQTSGTSETLDGVSCVDAQRAWAVALDGGILATTNGGTTWTAQASGTTEQLHDVDFVDAAHGWAVGGSGTVLVYSVPKPSLNKLSPTAGPRGSKVTLTGKDFGGKRGTSYVKFGSKKVTRYVSWSATKVVCKVPSKAPKGKLTVTLTTASGKSNGRTYRVK